MRIRSFLAMGLVSLAAACGGGGSSDDDGTQPDAHTTNDIDAAPAHECNTVTDFGTPTIGGQVAQGMGTSDAPTMIDLQGTLNADATPDALELQFYMGYGVFTTAIAPGTYELSGDELNGSTCGLCTFIFADVDTAGQTAKESYFATAGSFTLTETGANITGTFTGLELQEVTIAQDGSLTTTPVDNGCTTSIASGSFTAAVTYQ
jgi:hypothetical protein